MNSLLGCILHIHILNEYKIYRYVTRVQISIEYFSLNYLKTKTEFIN